MTDLRPQTRPALSALSSKSKNRQEKKRQQHSPIGAFLLVVDRVSQNGRAFLAARGRGDRGLRPAERDEARGDDDGLDAGGRGRRVAEDGRGRLRRI